MKMRHIYKLPLLDGNTAEKLGEVERAVIGDDFRVLYLVAQGNNGRTWRISCDDVGINEEAVFIYDRSCIKSFQDGEQWTVYEAKMGDRVFDEQGKELGTVSDFIIDCDNKEIWGVEVSGGIMRDLLDGRGEVPLSQLHWATLENTIYEQEGKNGNDDD